MTKLRSNCDQTAKRIQDPPMKNLDDFNLFCKVYRDVVFKAIKNRCHRNDEEDIVQETFMRVMRSKNTYDPSKASLGSWVSKIAQRTAIDVYRVNRRWIRSTEAKKMEKNSYESQPRNTDELIYLNKRLTKEEISLIRLKYLQDMQYEQIADVLSVPVGTVKSLLHRIKTKSKTIIQDMR